MFSIRGYCSECFGSSPVGSLILRARSRSEALAWIAAVNPKRSPHCKNMVFLQADNMNSGCDQAKLDGSTSLVSPLTNRYLWLLLATASLLRCCAPSVIEFACAAACVRDLRERLFRELQSRGPDPVALYCMHCSSGRGRRTIDWACLIRPLPPLSKRLSRCNHCSSRFLTAMQYAGLATFVLRVCLPTTSLAAPTSLSKLDSEIRHLGRLLEADAGNGDAHSSCRDNDQIVVAALALFSNPSTFVFPSS